MNKAAHGAPRASSNGSLVQSSGIVACWPNCATDHEALLVQRNALPLGKALKQFEFISDGT